ncbi:MAG: Smr/MutS family protein, partial [Oscillospiraceae bacterium]
YRLLIGTPGRSNAFEISRKLGLSDEILETATKLIANDKKNFEDVIDGLESSRQDFEQKSVSLDKETMELKRLKEELRNSNLDAINEKERIIEKARLEAQRIVENVKLDSQLLMDELDKIRKQKDKEAFSQMASAAKSQIRGKIDKLHDKANPVVERNNEDYVLPRKLKKGDSVLIVDIDKTGYVLEEPRKTTVLVQVGIIKSRVEISNIRLVEAKKAQVKGSTTRRVTSNKVATVSMELDLRGMMVEEALMEVDMFLNKSLLANVSQIMIIHGKGTGALRAAVHSYLKQSKYIKSYRLGVFGEGEAGVTIAELK